MTTPDPVDPVRDDSPTAPVELPPPSFAQPPPAAPPTAGAAPWDAPGPIPPAGAWAPDLGTAPALARGPDLGPGPATPGSTAGAGPTGPEPVAPTWPPSVPPQAQPPQAQPAQPHTQPQTRPGLVAGIVLVVIGVVVLLVRLVDVALGSSSWPLWIMVPGLAMLAGSLAIPPRAGLGLAVPGTMIAIVGAILWVQVAYGLYATWAYAWALVAPTGPGLAMLIYGLARGDRELAADGLRTTLVGLGLFLGFALFFEGVVGISGHRIANLDEVLPYIVIAFGVLLVVASLFGGRRDRRDQGRDRRDQGGIRGG